MLLLNGSYDLETNGMSAVEFLKAIQKACNRYGELDEPVSSYVDTLLILPNSEIPVDRDAIEALGVQVVEMPSASPDQCR